MSIALPRRARASVRLMIWSDRKSTRLNSSHANISYAVFCLKNSPLGDLLPLQPLGYLVADVRTGDLAGPERPAQGVGLLTAGFAPDRRPDCRRSSLLLGPAT